MKLYWDTIRRPSRDRWYRWFIVVLLVSTNIPNIIVGTMGSIGGDVRWLNVVVMLFSFVVLAGHMYFWARQDLDNRPAAPIITTTAATFLAPPDIIPVTRPEDAADPFAFAIMTAMYGDGESASIYRDDEGVWRDSITDAVLPVQDPKEEKP